MERSTCQNIALIITLTIFIVGTAVSIIGAIQEAQTNSPGEGVVLIVCGASMMGLAGLVISVAGKILTEK